MAGILFLLDSAGLSCTGTCIGASWRGLHHQAPLSPNRNKTKPCAGLGELPDLKLCCPFSAKGTLIAQVNHLPRHIRSVHVQSQSFYNIYIQIFLNVVLSQHSTTLMEKAVFYLRVSVSKTHSLPLETNRIKAY